ncbi:MAG: tRNA (guanosine(46)-N7)-methyltransferase TrmB [Muribaculaceae bacterium]|nr:tRNA (guanosine(46)-N7)-methyltransferase TrmB [Muribaculaceae bacterium]
MGKNKLKKFSEMEQLERVLQYPYGVLKEKGFPLRGHWHDEFFGNNNPIVLELGCGKGEYAVGLARRFPDKNFIGIDIKGARMYTGAKQAHLEGLGNVGFLRTNIELLPNFFAPGEVSEIWITFPDPQMRKERKRLTSTRFMQLYREVLKPDGIIHLKTDSPFLYTYTHNLVEQNGIVPIADTSDLYNTPGVLTDILEIRTHYEQQWLDRGLSIKYISFPLDHTRTLVEPEGEIPFDTYRSYSRGVIQGNIEPDDASNE